MVSLPLQLRSVSVDGDFYGRGIFRQLWMTGHGVIAICEADSCEQLNGWLAELPMAKAGLISYEITPLAPYRGFGSDAASM